MTSENPIRFRISRFILAVLILMPGAVMVQGQTKQLLTWQSNLNYLQNIPDSELEAQKDSVEQIRTGLEFWLELHPQSTVQLPEAPPQPWNVEQIKSEISALQVTVQILLKQGDLRPFDLGVTDISVTSELSPLSPVADSINSDTMEKHHATDVTETFQYLPGVTVDFKPARNQAGIMIRGFDTRQVGFFLDGIPVSIPYDGYVDMKRFLTDGAAEVQIAKGYSSPLLGPNGLGGAVNIVTQQPEKKFEGSLDMGTGSGELQEAGFHAGSRLEKYMFQGGVDWLQTDFSPISGDFELNPVQPTYDRTNSDSQDADFDARAGYMPNSRDRYIFSFTGQRANYGAPPYAGSLRREDPKYRRWPYWDRDGYYVNIGKGLGEQSDLQIRLFYDLYENRQDEYNGPKWSQFTPESFDELYTDLSKATSSKDNVLGGSVEFSTRVVRRHALSASLFFKDDTHTHFDTDFSKEPSVNLPSVTHRDWEISIGAQDSITITGRLQATAGFSLDHLDGVKAQNFIATTTGSGRNRVTTYSVMPFACSGSTTTDSFPGCIDTWAVNPLASVSYSLSKSGTLFASFALKSHFPYMKDRYDYKNDKAIPNPTLEPEHSRNWSIGYSHAFQLKTVAQIELFRSDVYDSIQKNIIPEPDPENPICTGNSLPGYCEQSINVAKELHQGVEFTLRSSALSRVILDLNYSFLSQSISGLNETTQVYPTGAPKHKAVGTAEILAPRNISLLVTARYESGTVGDYSLVEQEGGGYGIERVPGSKFATVDLGGVIPIYDAAKLYVGIDNLFDRNYYYLEGYPSAGRNWYLNLKCRF